MGGYLYIKLFKGKEMFLFEGNTGLLDMGSGSVCKWVLEGNVVEELGLNLFTSPPTSPPLPLFILTPRVPARNEKVAEVGANGEGVEEMGKDTGESANEPAIPFTSG
jgi:hypothetical protein